MTSDDVSDEHPKAAARHLNELRAKQQHEWEEEFGRPPRIRVTPPGPQCKETPPQPGVTIFGPDEYRQFRALKQFNPDEYRRIRPFWQTTENGDEHTADHVRISWIGGGYIATITRQHIEATPQSLHAIRASIETANALWGGAHVSGDREGELLGLAYGRALGVPVTTETAFAPDDLNCLDERVEAIHAMRQADLVALAYHRAHGVPTYGVATMTEAAFTRDELSRLDEIVASIHADERQAEQAECPARPTPASGLKARIRGWILGG